MKKTILLTLSLLMLGLLQAQVGINTENPLGVFHIHNGTAGSTNKDVIVSSDGNVGVGTLPSSTSNLKLHIAGNEFVSGISKFGGTAAHNMSAQLELADNNKGFLPNRVALTSSTDRTTVLNPLEGMVVYNTNTTPSLGRGLVYYDGQNWIKMVTELPSTTVNLMNLKSKVLVTQVGTNLSTGTKLSFDEIIIPEDGSYTFSYRLYGSIICGVVNSGITKQFAYYIGLIRGGTEVMDAAEMDILVLETGAVGGYTYSITLSAKFNKGDKVTTSMSKLAVIGVPDWSLTANSNNTSPARTSMIWWKL